MKKWDFGSKGNEPFIADRTKLRVRYAETDAMGWVYYATYLSYFEVGRTELIRNAWKPYREIEAGGLKLPVVEAACRYVRGARYDDELDINTHLTLPTAFRIRFDYRILRDGLLIAEGQTIHCFVGQNGKPVVIPPELTALVART